MASYPVLIVGAGIVGLTLARLLRKLSIPFVIFERDASPDARSQGWGITLHWILPHFLPALPHDIRQAIFECQVDPSQWEHDTGNFLFLNIQTMEPKYKVPPTKKLRVRREKLRHVLMRDVNVQWCKQLVDVKIVEGGVEAVFADGSTIKGSILVGADGSNSRIRQFVSEEPELKPLPIQMLGTTVTLTAEEAAPLRAIDPLLFQGAHPENNTFLYVSLLNTSATKPSDVEYVTQEISPTNIEYTYQLCLSYPISSSPDNDTTSSYPDTGLSKLLSLAQDIHPTLRQPFLAVPSDAKALPVTIADWESVSWDGKDRITLVGDAAHAMTMFRGDGANQGILDVLELAEILGRVYKTSSIPTGESLGDALRRYERQMQPRARMAVSLSRQACLDAHDWSKLNADSPIVSRRNPT